MYNDKGIKGHITKNCVSFTPLNIEKYKGRYPILCRSSWETSFCKFCDSNSSIISWASEPIVVTYQDPIEIIDHKTLKPKMRRYYPDFLILTNNNETILVEIKPYKETIPPVNSSRKARSTLITESKRWATNQAKWKAAKNYCEKRGWIFKILTEKELFNK